MKTPEEAVLKFIEAHQVWETDARQQLGITKSENAITAPVDAFRNLIQQFCAQTVTPPKTLCFSDGDRAHDSQRENIEFASITGSSAHVATRICFESGGMAVYDYHLTQDSSEWRINSISLSLNGRKYDCLETDAQGIICFGKPILKSSTNMEDLEAAASNSQEQKSRRFFEKWRTSPNKIDSEGRSPLQKAVYQ